MTQFLRDQAKLRQDVTNRAYRIFLFQRLLAMESPRLLPCPDNKLRQDVTNRAYRIFPLAFPVTSKLRSVLTFQCDPHKVGTYRTFLPGPTLIESELMDAAVVQVSKPG